MGYQITTLCLHLMSLITLHLASKPFFQHFRGNHGTTLFQKPILQNTYKVQLTFLNHQQFPEEWI